MGSMRLTYGVGVMDILGGTGDYGKGKRVIDPFYGAWSGMLMRCYSDREHQRFPTYADCSVYEPWLRLSNFKSWMVEQRWDGWCLDKDIIVPGNKVYAPEFCSFVPTWLNCFLHRSKKTHGDLPMGVVRRYPGKRVRYQAVVGSDSKNRVIGRFDTPEEAHSAFLLAKADETMKRIERYRQEGGRDQRVVDSLVRQADEMRASA